MGCDDDDTCISVKMIAVVQVWASCEPDGTAATLQQLVGTYDDAERTFQLMAPVRAL